MFDALRYLSLGEFDCSYCGHHHPRAIERCPTTGRSFDAVHKLGGTVLDGKYGVGGVIAEGGMAVIYRARHRTFGREVAIKFLNIRGISSREAVLRFLREARLAGRVDHPGIVRTFDHGVTQEGIPYIVMELLEGEDLASRLERSGWLRVEEAVHIMEELLEALSSVHASGIVHRDLKPENIFLARQSGGSEIVKILDFGVSRLVSDEAVGRLTEAGRVYGTPLYVSPEAARGAEVDARADIYGCGVLLYEMLVGRPPFTASSVLGLLHDVVSKPPPDPLDMRPDLPPAIVRIIMRALEKDPMVRFTSTGWMLRALRIAWREHEVDGQVSRSRIGGPPPTSAYRIIGPPEEHAVERVPLMARSRGQKGPTNDSPPPVADRRGRRDRDST